MKKHPSAEGIGFPSKGAVNLGILWGGATAQAMVQKQLVTRLTGLNEFVAQLVARSQHMPPTCRQLLYDFMGVVATTGAVNGRLKDHTLDIIKADDMGGIADWIRDPCAHLEDREVINALQYQMRKSV